ncbi:DUF523 domain-containing protein [Candidatus Woesearchaeota archaeon]|jgi:uncharacterized protein YbbK (DUF523 family)|nr:DUF523 domain-containing protein [Candidatus Woesearchaeota archaeon]MBT7062383.1 DUF523 domain-containing protein [Candidatus Woesearchaeota archaeon]MBT7402178.1 DUF523 domain-containing protein [Candidatus Woesearchaeota archaeon]
MRIVSACLLGYTCRYDCKSKPHKKVIALFEKEYLTPVCPEQLGGLPTPRTPSEQQGDKIISKTGEDVTAQFTEGAQRTLNIAKAKGIEKAIMKQKSPSCGCGKIYDGTFTGTLIDGDGVTTTLLKKNGIEVITEEDL